MQIQITMREGVPIYVQIAQQVKLLIASGRLNPGEELPAIRALAEQLVINPNTVARAYRELEVAGLVEKRRTAGTFVSEQAVPVAKRERLKLLTDRIDQLLVDAAQLSISTDELIELVRLREAAVP